MELGDKYDVLEEAQNIVEHEDEESVRQEALRALAVRLHGACWQHCTIQRHTARDARAVYTAAILCPNCNDIHVLVLQMEED
jgi:hypothetical protein